VRFNDGEADSQSHTRAVSFSGKELSTLFRERRGLVSYDRRRFGGQIERYTAYYIEKPVQEVLEVEVMIRLRVRRKQPSSSLTRAIALTYYLRSGIYLGPELLSVIPSASRIKLPVLVISGGQDWIAPTDKARQILSVIPQKELLVIPNAAHDTAYSVAPTVYASAVLSFLERSIKSNGSVPD